MWRIPIAYDSIRSDGDGVGGIPCKCNCNCRKVGLGAVDAGSDHCQYLHLHMRKCSISCGGYRICSEQTDRGQNKVKAPNRTNDIIMPHLCLFSLENGVFHSSVSNVSWTDPPA